MGENNLKIQLVIFDMDGVLLDTESVLKQAWQEVGMKYIIQGLGDKTFLKVVFIYDPKAT